MNYQQALGFLYSSLPMYQRVGAQAYNKDLKRTIELCKALHNPQDDFRSVHIAGTNGKGSSAHALSAILQSAGLNTGLYTSPHLKSFTERIRIDGQEITEQEVVDFVVNNKSLLEELQPSFFEVTVAMAFWAFSRHKVDLAVVEVGMGGRLDSTNVLQPEACLITRIGLDHQQFLGETLPEIAREKAGIIKGGVPVVIGADQPQILDVFREESQHRNAALHQAKEFTIREKADQPQAVDVMKNGSMVHEALELSLSSNYFRANLPGILTTVDVLTSGGYAITSNHVRQGLGNMVELTGLKGRWQVLSTEPLTICDVGHNIDGIQAILQQIKTTPHKQLHVVFGTVNDKKLDDILELLPRDACYYFCQATIPRALEADSLCRMASEHQLQGEVIHDVNEAISTARSRSNAGDMIFIGGSTFVVAEIEGL